MAAKTIDHIAMFVPITPYTVGNNTFCQLRISVKYSKGHGFKAEWLPCWGDSSIWGCVIDGGRNPLTAGGSVLVEPASRNNAKRLQAMFDNLNSLHPRKMISDVFDRRELKHMNGLLYQITLSGWTTAERYLDTVRREDEVNSQLEAARKANNNSNNQTSTTMELKINNNESANVQNGAQVNNTSNVEVHEVDVIGMMSALKKDGKAKLSDHFKDAEVVEPVSETKAEEPKAEPAKANEKKRKPSSKEKDAPAYSVVLLPTKDGGQWPKLYGFKSEKEAKAIADKLPKSVTASWDYGPNGEGRETKTKHWCLKMGKRYCDAAKTLCEALNSGDKTAIGKACAASLDVYELAKAAGKAEREAAKAEKNADEKPAPAAKTYTDKDVAAMLRDVLAGKELPKEVAELIAA